MHISRPTIILTLAIALAWLGWSAVWAEAQMPSAYQTSEGFAPTACGQCTDQGRCEEVFQAIDKFFELSDCGPRWTFTAEGIALQRSNTRSQVLFTDRNSTVALPPVDAKDLNFPVGFGPQVSVTHHGACGWDVEVAYFQVDGFDVRTDVPGFLSLMVTDSNGSGFFVTDQAPQPPYARYRSALYSGEVNLKRCWTDWLTLLAGFRIVELDERYHAEGTGARTPVFDTFDVNTFNRLYGFQLGADAEAYNMGGPLLINILCRAGVYGNFASQISHRVDTGFTDDLLAADRSQAAFLGEAGVVATYALTKHLAFRASWQVAWLEGVALAPEQIGANNFSNLTAHADTAGGVFYYGGGMGLEYRF
jgi:hypothetical protein